LYPNQTSDTQRFFPVVGNHDVDRLGSRAGYIDYFISDPAITPGRLPVGYSDIGQERVYYDFVVDNIHFFALDSAYEWDFVLSTSPQQLMYEQRIASSTADWNFPFFHHAVYSSGGEANADVMDWAAERSDVDAVFTGHDHIFDHIERDGTQYFVVGTGGQALYGLRPTPAGCVICHGRPSPRDV
jgi:hypothetical protein